MPFKIKAYFLKQYCLIELSEIMEKFQICIAQYSRHWPPVATK